MKVIKRDGRAVDFNGEKIGVAIEKANMEVSEDKRATPEEIKGIINYIKDLNKVRILVEDIQDIIEQKLMELDKYELAKKYIVYRYTRALVRRQNTTDESILGLIKNVNNNANKENRNNELACVQRDLIAGEVSKDLTKRILLPKNITKAHEEEILNFHDMEYFLQPIINSCVVNIGDMLDYGTNINFNKFEVPQDFEEACIEVSQIISAISCSQYGEQFINIKHLGKYLRISKSKIEDELYKGIRILKCQIESIINTYKTDPKVVLILDVDDNDKYYNENKMIVSEILKQDIKNCRFITDKSEIEKYKNEGHFNYGMVSINLAKIAISVKKEESEFWNILEDRIDLCYEALMCRHYALLGVSSGVSQIHWQNGAIARLQPGEKIDRFLRDGCSDIGLGYFGLKQTVDVLAKKFEFDETIKQKFEGRLIKFLEDKVQRWRKMTGIGFMLFEE